MKPTNQDPPDHVLLESSRKGDFKAFEVLVVRYQNMVFRFLFHFMGNATDAEDITQETFLNLYRKLHLYNSAQPFTSWLMTMARNLAISSHRKHTPTPLDPEIVAQAIKDICSGPETEILLREQAAEVHAALQKLPEQFREVLVMRYLLDIPLQDVAELLNIPEGTAKSRIFKARNELREIMGKSPAAAMFQEQA
jgi:RNA polymerase sigma-70 factor (ECF subfamily)